MKDFYWQCPECGTVVRVDDPEHFPCCTACGFSVSSVDLWKYRVLKESGKDVICPSCGTRVSATVKFCPECGARIAAARPSFRFRPHVGSLWASLKNGGRNLLASIRAIVGKSGFYRLQNGKAVGGVCLGIANRFGWNVSILRIGLSFSTMIGAFPLVVSAYLLLWLVLPVKDN